MCQEYVETHWSVNICYKIIYNLLQNNDLLHIIFPAPWSTFRVEPSSVVHQLLQKGHVLAHDSGEICSCFFHAVIKKQLQPNSLVSLQLVCLAVLSLKPEAKNGHICPSLSNLLFLYHHKQSQGAVKL